MNTAVSRRLFIAGATACAAISKPAWARSDLIEPAAIEAHVRGLVEEFIERLPGGNDYEAPDVRIAFTPQLAWISYAGPHVIHIAPWEALPSEFRAFFASLLEGQTEAQVADFYRSGFYSFLVPHEMAHFVDFRRGRGMATEAFHENELKANRVAVAFWAERPGGLVWMSRFIPQIEAAVARLPVPVPPGEDTVAYFNANYEALGADPAAYAWFQYQMCLEAWARRDEADFASLIGEA